MKNASYSLKISPQSQVTLPKTLRQRLQVQPGSRIVVTLAVDGASLEVSSKLPIEKHYGKLANVWTSEGQDAAEFSRALRNDMQHKLNIDQ